MPDNGTVIDAPLVNSYVVGVGHDAPDVPNVTGATAGSPGSWTPGGAEGIPSTVQALMNHQPPIVASPATPWTIGQYVQTGTPGAPGEATWTGSAWVGGRAPLAADSLDAMTKDELIAYADAHGVAYASGATKAEVRAAIDASG